jgi:FAD/FMN-containing dehydrogenase
VLADPDMVVGFVNDWTGRFRGHTPAVVRPGSVAEVAAVVTICRELGLALVPQGGNTGLVGGGVPLAGEIVLSLRRLDAITEVDADGGQITAGAGVTVATLHDAAGRAGWGYGVDLASRDSATVGGTIATNAGGLRVIRYGDTRRQLVGIEAVLGTGDTVSHLAGLRKDNTGYHLPSLLCGSEGTLGIVTAARLDLVPRADHRVVALLGFDGVQPAVSALGPLRRSLPALAAAELFFDDGLALVCESTGVPAPFEARHQAYLLVEVADQRDPMDGLTAALGSIGEVADVAIAADPAPMQRLWHYREAHTEAINRLGAPHKLDVTLPTGALAEFVPEVRSIIARVDPGARAWLFGHAGDGNIHVNVTGVAPDDERVDEAVLRLVSGMGGSISAEHGIGTAKRAWLHLNRSDTEMRAFRSLKRALDPDSVLNPGVLLPA